MTMGHDREELEKHVAAVQRDLEAVVLQAKEAEDALERLKASEMEAAGRLSIAGRAQADLEQRLAQLQGAQREAERAEAEETLREAVAARDRMADEAAEAIASAVTALANLHKARAAIEHARKAAEAVGAERPKTSPGEPPAFAEEWSRLEQLVRDEANLQLESDLVEAAAKSSTGYAIRDLPAHLQHLARQRRRTLLGQR
jgi:chromosome segregation ATPase